MGDTNIGVVQNSQKTRIYLVSRMKNIPQLTYLPFDKKIKRVILTHVRADVAEYILYKRYHDSWIIEKHELNGVLL